MQVVGACSPSMAASPRRIRRRSPHDRTARHHHIPVTGRRGQRRAPRGGLTQRTGMSPPQLAEVRVHRVAIADEYRLVNDPRGYLPAAAVVVRCACSQPGDAVAGWPSTPPPGGLHGLVDVQRAPTGAGRARPADRAAPTTMPRRPRCRIVSRWCAGGGPGRSSGSARRDLKRRLTHGSRRARRGGHPDLQRPVEVNAARPPPGLMNRANGTRRRRRRTCRRNEP